MLNNIKSIKDLKPETFVQKFVAAVQKKGQVRSCSNQSKKVLDIIIRDLENNSMQIALWDDAINPYEHLIEVGRVYEFNGAQVRTNSPNQFNPAVVQFSYNYFKEGNIIPRPQMEMMFEPIISRLQSPIKFEQASKVQIQEEKIVLHSIKQIQQPTFSQEYICTYGLILSISEVGKVNVKKNNQQVEKVSINLVDEEGSIIEAVFWNELSRHPDLKVNNIIIALNMKVGEFRGIKGLSNTKKAQIVVDEGNQRVKKLIQVVTHKGIDYFKALELPKKQNHLDFWKNKPTFAIRDMLVKYFDHLQTDMNYSGYFNVLGRIDQIKLNNHNPGKEHIAIVIQIGDHTHQGIYITCFDDLCEKLIGKGLDEIQLIYSENREKLDQLLQILKDRVFLFQVKAQLEVFALRVHNQFVVKNIQASDAQLDVFVAPAPDSQVKNGAFDTEMKQELN